MSWKIDNTVTHIFLDYTINVGLLRTDLCIYIMLRNCQIFEITTV